MLKIYTKNILLLFLLMGGLQAFSYPVQISNDSTSSCTGSLGENIFTDGDFGSGTSNVLMTNPQIAPGYSYTTAPPPADGYYTLSNNTGAWGNNYSSWLGIRDNSTDPRGYFMVVNASFTPGLFYEQVVDNLCPNTQYEFGVDIINMIRRNVTDHILPDVTLLLNDQVVLTTGRIAQTEEWNHYSVSFCTGPNQSSMKLSIRNNAPGGVGNDLGLDNISFRACGPEASIIPADTSYVCLDDDQDPVQLIASVQDPAFNFFQWQVSDDNGNTWQDIPGANQSNLTITQFTSGSYLYRYIFASSAANLSNSKCRLISTSKTLVAVPIFYTSQDTICTGNSWRVGNSVYTQTGIYVDSLTSSLGCDSIHTTQLTVLPVPPAQVNTDIVPPGCFGSGDASIRVTDVSGLYRPLTYTLDGQNNTNGFFPDLFAGTYVLEITDRYDCRYEENIWVEDPEPIVITTIADTTLRFGERLEITTQINRSGLEIQWLPERDLSCYDCLDPIALAASHATYIVTASNPSGCSASDTLNIRVEKAAFPIFAPTAFTPNGDGFNDIYEIIATYPEGISRIEQFAVFNRWGAKVYETTGTSASGNGLVSWDGTGRNGIVPEGVYVFMLSLELIDATPLVISGSITLVK